mmetsp:Transcript_30356/g.80735  ORF Transcript_30356/g.80735 Transcript_30356/m.80735 type:complete len:294 (+) Transcript_30356:1426-2307(+)
MSRSRKRSSILLRSPSPSRFSASFCSWVSFISCFSWLRALSACLRSSSTFSSLAFRASYIFMILSFSALCCWISSSFVRFCRCRCSFSWMYFSLRESSCSSLSSSLRFSSTFCRTFFSRRSSSCSAIVTSSSTFLRSVMAFWMLRCCVMCSSWRSSLSSRRSFICVSRSSLRRFSASITRLFSAMACFICMILSSESARACSTRCTSASLPATMFASISVFVLSMSRSLSSWSLCPWSWRSSMSCWWLTMDPSLICSDRSLISAFSLATFSFARRSRWCVWSTAFLCASISRR